MRSLVLMEAERHRSMPKALDEKVKSRAMQLVFTPTWMARVNEWRRAQPSNPNISAAIRMLVDLAIDAGLKEPPKQD